MDRLKLYRLGVAGAAFLGTLGFAGVRIASGGAVPEWWQALVMFLAGAFVMRRNPNGDDGASRPSG